ncbi:adventurous gliding motility TPR repeat lipoprotein GltE [Anaeromyxobacter diazotrophicus]|nr:adventurous gliding motility TPR repeat lipoprotein GltE [Anaeromyxobacter diazotrophicus]
MTLRLALPLAGALLACAGGGGSAPRAGGRPDATSTSTSNGRATSGSGSGSTGARAGSSTATASRPPAPPRRELSPRGQRLFDEALAAAEEQKRLKVPTDWETLERRWRAVTEAEPVPEAWFNLGVALEHRGRPGEARAAYQRALELEPRLAPAAANLLLLDEPKDPALAAQRWSELARRHPDDAVSRARLAALYEAAGQRDEAWKLAREALLRDPRAVGAYKVMMRVALGRGKPDLAHLLAVKARKLDPADAEIVSFVGDVLAAEKDRPGAVAQWRKAIALDEGYVPARYALLADAFGKQHWEGVAEHARAILRSDPDPRVQLALGVALRYLGKPDQALAAYDQAEKLGAGKLPEVHLARGVALMKSKEQCEPALAELRRYVVAAGPAAASEGPAMRLTRECEQIVLAGRQAEEAARELKAEADREAARKAAQPAKEPRPAGARGPEATPAAKPVPPASGAGTVPSPGPASTPTADGR